MVITIIDYGIGNIGSLENIIRKAGGTSIVTSNPEDIKVAKKLILPGVGAFDNGMKNLNNLNLIEILNKKVLKEKIPILGVCLGIQLFTKSSEEGILPGLGWIDARTVKFNFSNKNLKIPHMGWNSVNIKKESKLFKGLINPEFYFVHSYHLVCNDEKDILATTNYGYDFISSIQKNNIFGLQFHPEKSLKSGLKIIENFIGL